MGDKEVAQILKKAADLIETHGWLQGEFGDVTRGFCAIGAIREAVPWGTPDAVYFRTAAINALAETLPPRFKTYPVPWNDYKGRKADSVIRHMRKVAQSLEEN